MATVLDMIDNLNGLDIHKEAIAAIEKTAGKMADLNREQLSAGYDSRGHKLSPHYSSRKYATMKNAMNPEPGMWHPDLILTGAFVDSFKVNVAGNDIEFEATDPKSDDLLERYGDDVLGLFDTEQEYYNERIFFPEFAGAIAEATGLKFE